ncbi:unnamed protein product, partial [Allacma fusca]
MTATVFDVALHFVDTFGFGLCVVVQILTQFQTADITVRIFNFTFGDAKWNSKSP